MASSKVTFTPAGPDHIPAVEQMTADRGFIVNSYAQVEFLLGWLIDKTGSRPEFASVAPKKMPMGLGGRVDAVKSLMAIEPLAKHRTVIEPLLDRALELEEMRHFLTHGFCEFLYTPAGYTAMRFKRIAPPVKGLPHEFREMTIRPEELSRQRKIWSVFTTTVMQTFADVFADTGIEHEL